MNTSTLTHPDTREHMIRICCEMNRIGVNQGTSGNLSVRVPDGFLITPTSLAYDKMTPEDIVEMRFDGTWEGLRRPSSEWRFHRDILASRPERNVVIHTHSMYATTLAVHYKEIPAFHYMVAVAGGSTIRCAPYATFGTQALSDHAVKALEGRDACLLGQHGQIAIASSLDKALWLAVEVEALARMYFQALTLGPPPILGDDEIARVIERIKTGGYGMGEPRHMTATSAN